MQLRTACVAALACLTAALDARAVLQPTPGGITIPVLDNGVTTCRDKNVQRCLDVGEGQAGLISAQSDALVAPETFQPTCTLTFTPIVKGGEDPLAFGWYNVEPDPSNAGMTLKPANNELYAMMVFARGFRTNADLAGVQPKALDLNAERMAGRYKGGQIAFWLAGGDGLAIDASSGVLTGNPWSVYFTEHRFNPGSGSTQTYYQVLTWQSVAIENAFYFGWEDLQASNSSDNDFDDLMFLVTGIDCYGGGQPCTTGGIGVCADGTMQCQKGVLTCIANQAESEEKCNALDDDCDGSVDNGDLCGTEKVCDRGRCVPRCGTGEFLCAAGGVCTERGVCVEASCADKECSAGQICSNGECSDACSGVVCPYGQACRNGGCINPCANIECDEGQSCILGVCQSCACRPCSGSQVCKENICVDTACSTLSCNSGTHCEAGNCVDDCNNAVCPTGQACDRGQCVPTGDVGVDAGFSLGDGGILPGNGSGTGGSGASAAGRATGNSAGCACKTAAARAPSGAGALLAFFAALALGRRRTRCQIVARRFSVAVGSSRSHSCAQRRAPLRTRPPWG